MKNHSLISNACAVILLAAMTAACSSEVSETPVLSADSDILFHSVVNDLSGTRAASNLQEAQIASGVKVGVFVAQGSGADDLTLISGGDNALLTADGEGGLTAAATMKWAQSSLYFYAYAPYSASNAGKLEGNIDFSVNADQAADADYLESDLLYGVPVPNPTTQTTDGKVTLNFNHALSKVIVTLKDNAADDKKLSAPTVSLLNMVTSGTLTVKTGQVIANATTSPVILGKFTSVATDYVAAGIIVPQTVKAGVAFIKVEDGGKSYTCALGADKALQEGCAYKYNVVFDGDQLTIDASSQLKNWVDDEDETDLYPTESKSYGVGDYVLADGSLLSQNEVSATDNVVGVIFSTTVSAIDAQAGYTAYVLGFETLQDAKPQSSGTLAYGDYTDNTTLAEEFDDLDGRSHTEYVQGLDDYASNFPLFDLSSLTVTLPAATYSGWFIPSIGQAIQLLNNLGGAGIPTSTAQKYYCVMPNYATWEFETISFSGKVSVFASTPAASTVIAVLQQATHSQTVIAAKRYATSSFIQHNDNSEVALMDMTNGFLSAKANGKDEYTLTDEQKLEVWGISSGGAGNSRSRFACIATKQPLTVGN